MHSHKKLDIVSIGVVNKIIKYTRANVKLIGFIFIYNKKSCFLGCFTLYIYIFQFADCAYGIEILKEYYMIKKRDKYINLNITIKVYCL